MCTLMNFTWQNDCNYWLCCWSLEQWDRRLPSECGCLSYDRMQSCQWTPTLKRNLLLPSWGSFSDGWMRERVTKVTRRAVSWKNGKGMGSQNMAWSNTDFLFLIGQLPCYLSTSPFCILTLLTLTMKMDTCSSEMMIWTHETTWCQRRWLPSEKP